MDVRMDANNNSWSEADKVDIFIKTLLCYMNKESF